MPTFGSLSDSRNICSISSECSQCDVLFVLSNPVNRSLLNQTDLVSLWEDKADEKVRALKEGLSG